MNDFRQRTSVGASSSAVGGTFAAGTEPGWNWGYDAKGQMVSSQHDNTAASSRYDAYDGMGDRTQHRDGTHLSTGGTATAYTPDTLNPYDAIGGLTPVYDADGYLTFGPLPVAPGALSTLAWNGANRLHQVAVSGGSAVQYHYDAQGRRIAMTKGSTRTYWVYDGWNLIAEYTGTVHNNWDSSRFARVVIQECCINVGKFKERIIHNVEKRIGTVKANNASYILGINDCRNFPSKVIFESAIESLKKDRPWWCPVSLELYLKSA